MMRTVFQTVRRPFVVRFTVADRLLATGQRLRVGETLVATTVALHYAAKRGAR